MTKMQGESSLFDNDILQAFCSKCMLFTLWIIRFATRSDTYYFTYAPLLPRLLSLFSWFFTFPMIIMHMIVMGCNAVMTPLILIDTVYWIEDHFYSPSIIQLDRKLLWLALKCVRLRSRINNICNYSLGINVVHTGSVNVVCDLNWFQATLNVFEIFNIYKWFIVFISKKFCRIDMCFKCQCVGFLIRLY